MADRRIFQVMTPILFVGVGAVLDGQVEKVRWPWNAEPTSRSFQPSILVVVAVLAVMTLVADFQDPIQRPSLVVSPKEQQYVTLLNSEPPGAFRHLTVAPEAIGYVCYDLIHTVCDDFLGLTNKTIAHNGTIYQPTKY